MIIVNPHQIVRTRQWRECGCKIAVHPTIAVIIGALDPIVHGRPKRPVGDSPDHASMSVTDAGPWL